MRLEATQIGIAVVERTGGERTGGERTGGESDGEYLVGFRKEGQVLAGHAEFPGGKCEPGEQPVDCAVRECCEESGLTVQPIEQLDTILFDYDHGRVELHFWLCRPVDGKATPGGEFQWIPQAELRDMPFPDGNAAVIQRLQDRAAFR